MLSYRFKIIFYFIFVSLTFNVETKLRAQDIEQTVPITQTADNAVSVSFDNKITLDVKGMNVIDILKILAEKGSYNISINGNVSGRVTLFLKNLDVWEAFEIVLISADLAYEKRGNVIYVLPERDYEIKFGKKYWDQRELKIFHLKYGDTAKARDTLNQMASSVGKIIIDSATNTIVVLDTPEKLRQMETIITQLDQVIEVHVFTLNYASSEKLEAGVKELLTKDIGIIKIDKTTNKIMIVDYADKIQRISDMVTAFDEKPMQVLIDAKIIELRPYKKFYSGINWDYWIEKYYHMTGAFMIPSPSGVTDKIRLGTVGAAAPAAKGDIYGVMDFLETLGETKIVSSPRIIVLNNQEAKILVGTKEAYMTSTVSEVGTSAVTTQNVNFVDVGIKLYVTPTINKEDYITLKIKPEVSSSERQMIKTQDKETEVPIVSTSEAETSLVIKDGVSIIMGGLKKVTRSKDKKNIPFLGKIPGLGIFFGSTSEEWSKTELVILLTPHIISGDRSVESELQGKK